MNILWMKDNLPWHEDSNTEATCSQPRQTSGRCQMGLICLACVQVFRKIPYYPVLVTNSVQKSEWFHVLQFNLACIMPLRVLCLGIKFYSTEWHLNNLQMKVTQTFRQTILLNFEYNHMCKPYWDEIWELLPRFNFWISNILCEGYDVEYSREIGTR